MKCAWCGGSSDPKPEVGVQRVLAALMIEIESQSLKAQPVWRWRVEHWVVTAVLNLSSCSSLELLSSISIKGGPPSKQDSDSPWRNLASVSAWGFTAY